MSESGIWRYQPCSSCLMLHALSVHPSSPLPWACLLSSLRTYLGQWFLMILGQELLCQSRVIPVANHGVPGSNRSSGGRKHCLLTRTAVGQPCWSSPVHVFTVCAMLSRKCPLPASPGLITQRLSNVIGVTMGRGNALCQDHHEPVCALGNTGVDWVRPGWLTPTHDRRLDGKVPLLLVFFSGAWEEWVLRGNDHLPLIEASEDEMKALCHFHTCPFSMRFWGSQRTIIFFFFFKFSTLLRCNWQIKADKYIQDMQWDTLTYIVKWWPQSN